MALSKKVNIKYNVDSRSAKRGLEEVSKGTDKVRQSTERARDELGRFVKSSKKTSRGISVDFQAIQGAAQTAGIAVTAVGLGFLKAAEQATASQVALDNLPFSINRARGATMGLVDDLTLQQQALAASQFGVAKTEEEFGRLARAATKLGLAAGKDATSSIEDLTNALARGEKEVLDNLNVILTQAEANEKYAQKIGKVASELTEAERKQAFMTIGLEKAEEAADKLNVRMDQSAQFILELKTQAINAGNYLARGFVGSLSNASKALENLLGDITGLNDELAELDALNGGRVYSFFNPDFAKNVEKAKELERTRKAQLADAKEMAEIEAETLAFERAGFEQDLRSLRYQIAKTTDQAKLNELLSKEVALKASILEMDGRNAEAEKLLEDDFLRRTRFKAQRNAGRKSDPNKRERLEFQQQLTEAINAERRREFAEAASLQRSYLADVRAFEDELAQVRMPANDRMRESNELRIRQDELQQQEIAREMELAQIRGNALMAYSLEQEALRMREESLRRRLEMSTQVAERERLQGEIEQVHHEQTIARIQEEQRARDELAAKQREIAKAAESIGRSSLQLSSTIASAAIKGEQRRAKVLAGIKATELAADGTISIVRGGIAIAAGNVPQGLAQIAAGTVAIAKAATIRSGGSGGGGGSATAGTATQFARGTPPDRAEFNVERGAPLSVSDSVEGNPNNTGRQGRTSTASRTINIGRIDVLGAIDDESANKIKKGLQRAEANLGA